MIVPTTWVNHAIYDSSEATRMKEEAEKQRLMDEQERKKREAEGNTFKILVS